MFKTVIFNSAVKVGGTLLAFLWQLCVFKVVGATVGGQYVFAYSCMNIIALLMMLGTAISLPALLPPLLTSPQPIRAYQRIAISIASTLMIYLPTILLTALGGIAATALGGGWRTVAITAAVLLSLPGSLIQTVGGALRGQTRQVHADIAVLMVPPIVSMILLITVQPTSFVPCLCIVALGQMIGFVYGLIHMRVPWSRFGEMVRGIAIVRQAVANLRGASTYGTLSLLITLYPDVSMAVYGFFLTPADLAGLSVAIKYVLATRFVLLSVNSYAQPRLATDFAQGNVEGCRRQARQAVILSTALSVPLMLLVYIFRTKLFTFFSAGLADHSDLIAFYMIGQIANILSGPSGAVLIACGEIRFLRNACIVCGLGSMFIGMVLLLAFGWGVYAALAALVLNDISISIVTALRARVVVKIPVDVFSIFLRREIAA